MTLKDTAQTLALAVCVSVVAFLVATPICLWILGSANSCKRMMCEILIMKRPMSDVSYCEAWFDLFR